MKNSFIVLWSFLAISIVTFAIENILNLRGIEVLEKRWIAIAILSTMTSILVLNGIKHQINILFPLLLSGGLFIGMIIYNDNNFAFWSMVVISFIVLLCFITYAKDGKELRIKFIKVKSKKKKK